jgi:hypothetical protein
MDTHTYDKFLKMIRDAIESYGSQQGVADAAGIPQSTISKVLGGKGVHLETMCKMLDSLGARLLGPEERPTPMVCDMGDYALVPKVKAKLGAGSSLVTDGEQAGLYAFRKDFLRRIGLEGNGDIALFDVIGDSMDPTIQHMDTVLVSRRETDPVSGQIYAIRVDDELLVKRILKEPGKLIVKSDNPSYGTFEINLAGPSASVEIIGRVRWQGRVY